MVQQNTALVPQSKGQLITRFASRFGVDPNQTFNILKQTAFRLPAKKINGKYESQAVTNEQMAALLIVADQYGLNPFTKEIYAFPDKNGAVVPVVGVDGWVRIINERPELDGIEFAWAENVVTPEHGKPCPEWIEVKIYRRDRGRPVVVREYLDEVYRPPFVTGDGTAINGPWQSHTKRMLRHRGLIQAARVAFGFSGLHDEDEADAVAVDVDFKRLSAPPDPEQPEDLFQDLIDELTRFDHPFEFGDLKRFCQQSAEANGAELNDFYRSALASLDDFYEAFRAWSAPRPTPKPRQSKPKPVPPVAPAPEPTPPPNTTEEPPPREPGEDEELFPREPVTYQALPEVAIRVKHLLKIEPEAWVPGFVKWAYVEHGKDKRHDLDAIALHCMKSLADPDFKSQAQEWVKHNE